MLKEIRLQKAARYESAQKLTLGQATLVFGVNGSGKSTISRLLDPDPERPKSDLQDCSLVWKEGTIPPSIYVYDQEYIKKLLGTPDRLDSLYTLEENIDSQSEIDILIQKKSNIQPRIERLTLRLKEAEFEYKTNLKSQREELWNLTLPFRQYNFGSLIPHKRNKEKFMTWFEEGNEASLPETENKNIENISSEYEIFASLHQVHIENLPPIVPITASFDDITNKLRANIVGARDLSISSLIERLNNQDWVNEGRKYLKASPTACPMCQQSINEDLERSISEFFNEDFAKKINEIGSLIQNIDQNLDELNRFLITIRNAYHEDFSTGLTSSIVSLAEMLNSTKNYLEAKLAAPSSSILVELDTQKYDDYRAQYELLDTEIDRIAGNKAIADSSREALISNIRNFFISQFGNWFDTAAVRTSNSYAKYQGIQNSLNITTSNINDISQRISNLYEAMTNISDSITDINKLLQYFGFDNFFLEASDDAKHYRIVRTRNGDSVHNLSEGERTFISFVYFCTKINSLAEKSEPIFAVIDDPVSSLDENCVSIISVLVKEIQKEAINSVSGSGIQQVLILTHNAYFLHDICFGSGFDTDQLVFAQIQKRGHKQSVIINDSKRPARSSYARLWTHIYDPEIPIDLKSNAMRRVLEHYFEFTGGVKVKDLSKNLSGADRILANSLISELHLGSHKNREGLEMNLAEDRLPDLQRVFEALFELNNQCGHLIQMRTQANKDLAISSTPPNTTA